MQGEASLTVTDGVRPGRQSDASPRGSALPRIEAFLGQPHPALAEGHAGCRDDHIPCEKKRRAPMRAEKTAK